MDRRCDCSRQAINTVANLIAAGSADIAIAAGVEILSRIALGMTTAAGGDLFPPELLEMHELTHRGIAGEKKAKQ